MNDRPLHPAVLFVEQQYFRTLLILFAALVFVFSQDSQSIPGHFRIFVPWLLAGLILTDRRSVRMSLLGAISALFAVSVALGYFSIANHGFVITYMTISLLIAVSFREVNEAAIRTASFWILAVLMGVALIQKLSSDYYMSGNFMADYVLSGVIQQKLISLGIPDWQSIVEHNVAVRTDLARAITPGSNTASVVVAPAIAALVWILTYSSIVIQFLMELALIMRRRLGLWVHYALLIFVSIIFVCAREFVFLSANCVLGYAMTDEKSKSVRLWYVMFVFYLLTTKLMT